MSIAESGELSGRPSGAMERRALAARAGIVAVGAVVSRVLGLAREVVLAALFSRAETDAFFVAFTIPSTLRQLLAEGAVASAVVPVLTQTRQQQGEPAGRSFFQALRGASLLVLVLTTLLGVAFAPALCGLFAPGFRAEPGQFERTVLLTRVVFPYLALMGAAALGMAALNTCRQFAVPAFSPAFMNVGMIACALVLPTFLASHGQDPTLGLALGALVGGAAQVMVQWPALRRIGYLRPPKLRLRDPRLREVGRRLLPMTMGMGVFFLNIALARRFLSDLGEGAQSYFTWAFRLCDLPQGIFIVAIATASLPALSSLAAAGQGHEVAKTYCLGMRLALFVALPASVVLVVLGHPLVVACFQRGEFGPESALQTSRALGAQALGLWSIAASRQLVPAFYAYGDTRIPTLAAAANLVVFVVLAWTLRVGLGHVGVGLAFTAGNIVQMLVLWSLLRRRLPTLHLREVGASVARTVLGCAGAAAAGWAVMQAWPAGPGASGWLRLAAALGSLGAFGAVFLGLAWMLGSKELGVIRRGLRHRR